MQDEEYVYYSIVDIQELSADVEDVTPHGPTKEGPLMFRIKESNLRWETAYFILKWVSKVLKTSYEFNCIDYSN